MLRVLEREGIRVAALAGSSIGGLIAAVYAAGNSPAAIEERMGALEHGRLLHYPTRAPNALIGLEGVEAILHEVIGDKHFEDLDIPLALTALDVVTGQEVVLNTGPVVDAVLATIAIPGVFPSRKIANYELVDGGLSNPVPVDVARGLAPNVPVVAVALGAPLQDEGNVNPSSGHDLDSLPIPGPVKRLKIGRAFMAFTHAVNVSGHIQGEMRLAAEKPDLILRPAVEHIGVLEDADVHDLARRGELATEAALPQLRRLVRRRPLQALQGLFSRH